MSSNKVDIWEKIKRSLRSNLLLIGIIFFAFAIRLYFFRNTGVERIEDSYILAKLARGILQGEYKI